MQAYENMDAFLNTKALILKRLLLEKGNDQNYFYLFKETLPYYGLLAPRIHVCESSIRIWKHRLASHSPNFFQKILIGLGTIISILATPTINFRFCKEEISKRFKNDTAYCFEKDKRFMSASWSLFDYLSSLTLHTDHLISHRLHPQLIPFMIQKTFWKKMDLTEKIAMYKKLIRQIEALEEAKRQIAKAIIAEMPERKFETPDYQAIRYQRLSIRTLLEQARLFSATKMEEQIDKEKIKQIFNSGTPIEGVEEQSYLIVRIKNRDIKPTAPANDSILQKADLHHS